MRDFYLNSFSKRLQGKVYGDLLLHPAESCLCLTGIVVLNGLAVRYLL